MKILGFPVESKKSYTMHFSVCISLSKFYSVYERSIENEVSQEMTVNKMKRLNLLRYTKQSF